MHEGRATVTDHDVALRILVPSTAPDELLELAQRHVDELAAAFLARGIGLSLELVPTCRVCGCTDDDACLGGCWWVDTDEADGYLCSSCVDADPYKRLADSILTEPNTPPAHRKEPADGSAAKSATAPAGDRRSGH